MLFTANLLAGTDKIVTMTTNVMMLILTSLLLSSGIDSLTVYVRVCVQTNKCFNEIIEVLLTMLQRDVPDNCRQSQQYFQVLHVYVQMVSCYWSLCHFNVVLQNAVIILHLFLLCLHTFLYKREA